MNPCGNSKFKKYPNSIKNPTPPAVKAAVCQKLVLAFMVKNVTKKRIMAGINPITTLNKYKLQSKVLVHTKVI